MNIGYYGETESTTNPSIPVEKEMPKIPDLLKESNVSLTLSLGIMTAVFTLLFGNDAEWARPGKEPGNITENAVEIFENTRELQRAMEALAKRLGI